MPNTHKRLVWKQFYFNNHQDWLELQAAWASHGGNWPDKVMRFDVPSRVVTNVPWNGLQRIRQLSFMRHPYPDAICMAADPDIEE